MKVSFVIPCYRSERTIGAVAAEIARTMETMPEHSWRPNALCRSMRMPIFRMVRIIHHDFPCRKDVAAIFAKLIANITIVRWVWSGV